MHVQVRVHLSSLNAEVQPPQEENGTSCSALIFDEKTRSESSLYAMQTTIIPPQVLLLVANKLQPQDDEPDE